MGKVFGDMMFYNWRRTDIALMALQLYVSCLAIDSIAQMHVVSGPSLLRFGIILIAWVALFALTIWRLQKVYVGVLAEPAEMTAYLNQATSDFDYLKRQSNISGRAREVAPLFLAAAVVPAIPIYLVIRMLHLHWLLIR
jgi:hypothetical protein